MGAIPENEVMQDCSSDEDEEEGDFVP